jgi:hypothetical protein
MKGPATISGAISAVAVGLTVPACAAVLGVDDPILDEALSADAGGLDANAADAIPEVAPVDVGPACADEKADEVHGLFVATGGISATTCGSKLQPCSTIGLALKRAQALVGFTTIYIDSGTYDETVDLIGGITLQGGWDDVGGNWRRQCTASRAASVRIVGAANFGVRAPSLSARSVLDTLSIHVNPAGPGQSTYGVFATGATTWLVLKDVSITAADGSAGAPGGVGAAGTDTAANCSGSGGANGGAGGAGAAAASGTFGVGGFVTGAGGSGKAGGNGIGTIGGDANSRSDCIGACDPDPQIADTCDPTTTTISSSPGTGGCGGQGGSGGAGGQGGGSSVAVYVWDAQVNLGGGLASAGNGGAGGLGGGGGAGAHGSGGSPGPSTSCNIGCAFDAVNGCVVGTPEGIPGGAAGAVGGTGGIGGNGGGGAGGYSYAVFQNKNAVVTIDQTTLAHGAPGAGSSGAPSGKADDRGTTP